MKLKKKLKNLLILKNQNLKGLNKVNQNMRKFILILNRCIFQMRIIIIYIDQMIESEKVKFF